MAESKYKFERLTPTDDVDLVVYEEAIDYVFQNPDIKSRAPAQRVVPISHVSVPLSRNSNVLNWVYPTHKGKSPENRMVPGFLSNLELVCPLDYLLENCGARLAALRPYFNRLSDDFP